MILEVPDTLLAKQLTEQITSIVLKQIDDRLALINKTVELPPYPNKSEVKKVLEIGDEKLNSWIANGLKVQMWSERDIRIERNCLQEFLRTMEV